MCLLFRISYLPRIRRFATAWVSNAWTKFARERRLAERVQLELSIPVNDLEGGGHCYYQAQSDTGMNPEYTPKSCGLSRRID